MICFINMKTGRKLSSFDVYVFVVLAAVELLMSFTFLGYIHVTPISITFAYVPILIAACLLGMVQSAVLGLVFGLASMYKATAFYVMPADMIFSPFLSGQPISSFFLAVGTRTLFGVLAAIYFSQRASYMLRRHGIAVSDAVSTDLIHLQIQFMLAVLSLNIISIIVLLSGYKYITYQKFLGELDVITGVMGRRIFLQCCEKAHRDRREGPPRKGWFLFLDVDNFKTINDTMGHATGDNVLKEVGAALKRVFGGCGIVGRMGGDEFAAMIDDVSVEESDMRTGLELFLAQIGEILPHSVVSSSIGVCRFEYPADIQCLMHEADKLLYEAKHRGRACYVFGEYKKED